MPGVCRGCAGGVPGAISGSPSGEDQVNGRGMRSPYPRGTRRTTNEGQKMLRFIMWICRRRAEHSRRLQDAKKRLLEYGVPSDHVDFLARHCAGTTFQSEIWSILAIPKKFPASAIVLVAYFAFTIFMLWLQFWLELPPQFEIAMVLVVSGAVVVFLSYASLADSRRTSSALTRMLLTVCEVESLLAFLQEENPLNRHEPKKISWGVPIHLKIDIINQHHLFREYLIQHSRQLALDTHVVAGYARKYDDERWSRSAQVFLWVSENLLSVTRAKVGQDHCGVLLAHITHNRFLEPVSVDPKHKPIIDLLPPPRTKIARFVNFPLVVALAGALVVSGASVAVALLRT